MTTDERRGDSLDDLFNRRDLIRGKLIHWTDREAPGAMLNGTRVTKRNSVPGDTHQDGARARIIGSIGPIEGVYGYFVHWDDLPGIPVSITSDRVEPLE